MEEDEEPQDLEADTIKLQFVLKYEIIGSQILHISLQRSSSFETSC